MYLCNLYTYTYLLPCYEHVVLLLGFVLKNVLIFCNIIKTTNSIHFDEVCCSIYRSGSALKIYSGSFTSHCLTVCFIQLPSVSQQNYRRHSYSIKFYMAFQFKQIIVFFNLMRMKGFTKRCTLQLSVIYFLWSLLCPVYVAALQTNTENTK